MHKDFAFKNMSQSYLKPPSFQSTSPPANSQSFYQHRPSTNYMSSSPDRMNHSFIAYGNSQPAQQIRPETVPFKQSETIRSCVQLEQKENARLILREGDLPTTAFKSIEQRMMEVERRI
jgi:hypothetical protein